MHGDPAIVLTIPGEQSQRSYAARRIPGTPIPLPPRWHGRTDVDCSRRPVHGEDGRGVRPGGGSLSAAFKERWLVGNIRQQAVTRDRDGKRQVRVAQGLCIGASEIGAFA